MQQRNPAEVHMRGEDRQQQPSDPASTPVEQITRQQSHDHAAQRADEDVEDPQTDDVFAE